MQPQPTAAEALNAPLFASLIERLHGGDRCVVLDLGAARTETLALFGQFRSRMDIADLGDGIERFQDPEMGPEQLRQQADRLLPARGSEPANVVLCWDLLNYLPRPALAAVMSAVADRARPGALVHALIVYSSKTMSARPGCFVPVDEQRLIDVAPPGAQRDAPRYSPEDLALCMPGYTVERGRLLRNGMQEFLFRL
ncbi:MAG: hypothetical protein JXB36_12780 [Gammaproteobacteria bacterium]|nr:hypothetical protein [Gammaproteobacteria bacterium]